MKHSTLERAVCVLPKSCLKPMLVYLFHGCRLPGFLSLSTFSSTRLHTLDLAFMEAEGSSSRGKSRGEKDKRVVISSACSACQKRKSKVSVELHPPTC